MSDSGAVQIWMCRDCWVECEPYGNYAISCPKCGRVYSHHDGVCIEGEGDDE